MTVKCNYSTVNLYHLLTYRENQSRMEDLVDPFKSVWGTLGYVRLFSALHLSSSQESPAPAWGGRGKAVGGEKMDALFHRELFKIFFFDFFLFFMLRSVLRSKAFRWD